MILLFYFNYLFVSSNYCGGCNRLWYQNGYDVTKRCGMYEKKSSYCIKYTNMDVEKKSNIQDHFKKKRNHAD